MIPIHQTKTNLTHIFYEIKKENKNTIHGVYEN